MLLLCYFNFRTKTIQQVNTVLPYPYLQDPVLNSPGR
jgi:hypothetical protein